MVAFEAHRIKFPQDMRQSWICVCFYICKGYLLIARNLIMTDPIQAAAKAPTNQAAISTVANTTNYIDQASIYSNGSGINPYMMSSNPMGGIFGASMPPGFEAYEAKFALAMNSPVAQFGGNTMSCDIQSMLSGFYNFFLQRAQAQTKCIGDKFGAPAAGKDETKTDDKKMSDEDIKKEAEALAKSTGKNVETITKSIKAIGLDETKKLLGITDDKKDDKKTEDDKGGKEVKKDVETDETKEAKKAKKEKEAADKKAAYEKSAIEKNKEYAVEAITRDLDAKNAYNEGHAAHLNRARAWVNMEDKAALLESLTISQFRNDVIRSAFGMPLSKDKSIDQELSTEERNQIWNTSVTTEEQGKKVGESLWDLECRSKKRDYGNQKVEFTPANGYSYCM